MKDYYLISGGKFCSCVGMSFCWSDKTAHAIIFNKENMGHKRADDFHRIAAQWAKSHKLGTVTKFEIVTKPDSNA